MQECLISHLIWDRNAFVDMPHGNPFFAASPFRNSDHFHLEEQRLTCLSTVIQCELT